MHCENTTFACNNEFNEYVKVEGTVLQDIFDYFLMLELENSYQKKERNICLNYLRNGIRNSVIRF